MKFKLFLPLFHLILLLAPLTHQAQITISGKVKDGSSGEALFMSTVYVLGTNTGTTTNEYGFFSLTFSDALLNEDSVVLIADFVGYAPASIRIEKKSVENLQFELKIRAQNLKEFEIKAEQTRLESELRSTQMSTTRIPITAIKTIPSIAGESDIMKVVQLLPGVARGAEGTTDIFVRGGAADQNLVLLDEAVVYNVGHLFGFFSVFNSDALKDMTMIKGAFPAQYGGRLSSILDIRMKEGNEKKWRLEGGVGLLSSRLTIEGPIIKDKLSILVAGRRTYIDKVFGAVGLPLPYYFYDLNGKINYKISDKDRIYFSTYLGDDVLSINGQDFDDGSSDSDENFDFGFGFNLGNYTNTLRWNHIYNSKLFSNVSVTTTKFDYDIRTSFLDNQIAIQSRIDDIALNGDFQYYRNENQTIRYGAQFTHHLFRPNVLTTKGDISEFVDEREARRLNFDEFGLYSNVDQKLYNDKLLLSYGLRLGFGFTNNRMYGMPEPRVGMRYSLAKNTSFKASYTLMRQYMHRVSGSSVTLPTDLWYPITANVRPQSAQQGAIGIHHIFPSAGISAELEGYYKHMYNLIEYREGANLILNDEFEADLVQGTGNAYGAEFLVKRDEGRLTGWVGYTLAWAWRHFPDLNNGNRFPAKYDRRHDVSIVLNYQLAERLTVSTVWVYTSGSKFTAQIGQYLSPNPSLTGVDIIPIFTERNAVSMSPSHRLDLNFTLKTKGGHGEWQFGGYNIYNQATPYRIRVVPTEDGTGYKYEQPGLFGFIPSIAYNFKF